MFLQKVPEYNLRARLWLSALVTLILLPPTISARDLTLDQALQIALGQTTRGEMIEGNYEVAEQLYSARRINMYVPEISINGSVPSYQKALAYQPYSSPLDRQPFRTSNLGFNSFIELKQTLLTGGSLTATANLISEDEEYPDTRYEPSSGLFVKQLSKQGAFRFSLEQPLFRPSAAKNELNNRSDDLEIAQVTQIEQTASLRKEVVAAYIGVLQANLRAEITGDKLKQSSLQEGIDSLKLADGVLSEEDFLLSSSSRLDVELENHSATTDLEEKQRELATLLDWDVNEEINLTQPDLGQHLDDAVKTAYVSSWEVAAPIKKAEHEFAKAKRAADYAASGHGLTGDLAASYRFGSQNIETDKVLDSLGRGGFVQEDISTNAWTVALEFKLPLFDGGAGSAAVRAARYQAEQARYEFTRTQRSARATIVNLLNQLDVSYQRMGIIEKQIALADNRLEIARGRYTEGRISELTLLEAGIFLLETRERYTDELRKYLTNRIDLESQFLN